MKKRILLISNFYAPELTGIGKYNGEMINWLAGQGYDCTVITTFPYYPHWKVQAPYKNRWYKRETINYPESNATVTIYRCPSFIPSQPTGKTRMIQDVTFWLSKIWVVLKLATFNKKHDLIFAVAPPFHLPYLGLLLRRLRGGKLVYHVQDLQIEAAQDLSILSSQKMFNSLYNLEKKVINSSDFVSSISEGMINKIKGKTDKEVLFLPNWADTSFFFPLPNREQLKLNWGYKITDTVYLYSGAAGEKQGLENIIFAAEKLQDDDSIKFIICSSGPYKQKLIELAENRKLKNVAFLPLQEREVFNEFLNMADVHLVIQKAKAGDLVMPSKLTNILAVGGVCLVTSLPGTSLHNVIDKYGLGYIVEPENLDSLVEKISEIKNDQTTMELKGKNARNYALKFLNLDSIMKGFTEKVLN